MSSQIDPAFDIIPHNSTFFLIWRIEKLEVIAVAQQLYGQFYSGDSYIIACATQGRERGDSQLTPKPVNGTLETHIHFWLGSQTSQDEAAVAAYKTVELDDYLGGAPVQHRETQGHESKRFLSYFRNGIRLLEGGISSGLNTIDLSVKPRLFQIKGKRLPIVKELPEISWNQLNDGDVFILDSGKYVFVWTGQTANHMEKLQAIKVANQLKAEHASVCESVIIVDDGNENDLTEDERESFNIYLPIGDKEVKSHEEEENNDEAIELDQRVNIKLYKCSDEDESLKVIEVKTGPLEQSDLNSSDSFIIDNNVSGIWVWIGKDASSTERTEAMRNAQSFIVKKNYPKHTSITRVIDGGEPLEFKSLFKSWRDRNETDDLGATYSYGRIARTISDLFDPSVLHENPAMAAETQMVDDGSGDKQVFRVKSFDLQAVDNEDYGKFYSGDCYLVIYTYGANNVIIYYWLGSQSSVDERGTAAIKTVEIDNNQFNGRAVQVRVVQGKEPPHFIALFGGQMIIFEGGFAGGFNNNETDDTVSSSDKFLLHVRGTNQYNAKAVQVECGASSLNSNDVFVLTTPTTVYVWVGKGSFGGEREMAQKIASRGDKELVIVEEGQETDEFWDDIGGQDSYSSEKRLQSCNDPHPPRLFQCSNVKGRFTIEEIVQFDQSDLIEDDVMLLDTWDTLFIWIGNNSNSEEREKSLEASQKYLSTDPSGRDTDTPIILIKQGYEPINFTGFFGVWNRSKKYKKSCAESENCKNEINDNAMNGNNNSENHQSNTKLLMKSNTKDTDFDSANKYSLEKLLTKDAILLPDDVDPSKKEIYLSSKDFSAAFGISYEEFKSLAKWRQVDMKKKVGLF